MMGDSTAISIEPFEYRKMYSNISIEFNYTVFIGFFMVHVSKKITIVSFLQIEIYSK